MPFSALSYTSGIPNPPNAPSVDVPNMQTNTNSIQTFLERDHVPFANNFAGAHLQLNLQNTNSGGTPTLPSLVAGAGFETLYATTNSTQIGGNSGELYFTRGGSGVQIQLTGPLTPTPSAAPAAGNASNGYTFLPGGLLLQWGFTTSWTSGQNPLSVNFPVAYNNLFSVTLGPVTGAGVGRYFGITAVGPTGFIVGSSSGSSSTGILWMAIGN